MRVQVEQPAAGVADDPARVVSTSDRLATALASAQYHRVQLGRVSRCAAASITSIASCMSLPSALAALHRCRSARVRMSGRTVSASAVMTIRTVLAGHAADGRRSRPVDPLELRFVVYRHFVETGRAPSRRWLAAVVADIGTVDRLLQELHDRHMLVLDDRDHRRGEIRMALPFAAEPTDFRVTTDAGAWWANCAWDTLTIIRHAPR